MASFPPKTASESAKCLPLASGHAGNFRRLQKIGIVLIGIILGQFILYAPSLTGRKILLPLDILSLPNTYLPATPGAAWKEPHSRIPSDLVEVGEPSRRFASAELRSGRLPLWNPYQYAGAPVMSSRFSPFPILLAAVESPIIIAWVEVLLALVAGTGAFVFFRRALQVAFWPAAVLAWCYPLTAFFILWQGFGLPFPVSFLPWSLFAIHCTVKKPGGFSGIGLAVVTWLVLSSGQLDVAGQVLLVSGFYAVWRCLAEYWNRRAARQVLFAAGALAAAWGIGMLLVTPDVLPQLEFAHTGARVMRRASGFEDRPPVGLAALPQTVLPFMYGSDEKGSLSIYPEGQHFLLESSAATYAGLLATLFLAPLSWCDRRRRHHSVFWLLLCFVALSWSLNVPGMVAFLRMPGLNMFSHSRLVFAASFAIVAMAAVGLDGLWRGRIRWQSWFWAPTTLLAALAGWCFFRAIVLPEPVASQIAAAVKSGARYGPLCSLSDVEHVQDWFQKTYQSGAVLCILGVLGWLALRFRNPGANRWLAPVSGALIVADLLWFGFGRNAQCDPALYFPPIPVLDAVAKSTPGRVVGYRCLPARLAEIAGLHDVRGYDAVDSARMMDIMKIAAAPGSPMLPAALTQWFVPQATLAPPDGIRLSPILDMLGVRYVIFRGVSPASLRPAFQGNDYWVLVNHSALPRVFVPRRVETLSDSRARLAKLAEKGFNPSETAYVEAPVNLPGSCQGSAKIVDETPVHAIISAQMATPGLVVFADLWDTGWHAYLNGKEAPILRTDHAIRGVVAPSGTVNLEFRYEPASMKLGFCLAALGGALLVGWTGVAACRRRALTF